MQPKLDPVLDTDINANTDGLILVLRLPNPCNQPLLPETIITQLKQASPVFAQKNHN
ncbi:hypothetical protein HBI56_127270 [Parastagonospora nodorum]|uniref:Uncharacterized protein n=2 Tax=Phaeosphaeria nodorum (strain SN15 / ATCC MYA-4574 / FGSC 10173) TaxID=321614 RepID=A0A7U2F4S1_PHANO|nr:hypothetical protein SNOG_04749 [Parastagonospora nodorum SN15]KAH3909136.1 hypothetical protein HBH56_168640 [Parastagonospora nodorum]EAT88509.1 hypothetical protein SNOG_04749 [Parastagonospora nodorum SN15]KAH3936423.1 hypothetical protein HBH54_031730 [Parastagonospora nodorum]KAH3989567.1 hypothetical protein HBH52_011570 [Parastagonospora nodorum]KAH4056837.1 hypothetical protein HBH49_037920 [Parastagonospora nodorum]